MKVALSSILLSVLLVQPQAPSLKAQQPASDAASQQASLERVVSTYCVTCHSEALKTAGLVLDPSTLDSVGEHAEIWEKVLAKVKSGDMPPPGMPRPEPAAYQALASLLESGLDRAAAQAPKAGSLPLLHRLTRTEYQNSIRDLLGIYDLPREMDYSLLLPADNTSSGFDNLADLLFVSPAIMERYLDAARKISRLAIGDPSTPVMVNLYRISPELPQDSRMEELPFGTRGGAGIRSYFPLDADYLVRVEIAGAGREPHQLEIAVDGVPLETLTVGGADRGPNRPEVRIPIQAGPHMLAVTFIQRSEAGDENTLRPRMRGRGTQPSVSSVTLRGPFDATGVGDTPARQRIFICTPDAREEANCARRILSNLVSRAFRRPATDADLDRLMPFYEAGYKEDGFERGIEQALERLLVSPQFLFRIEREPDGLAPGEPYPITGLELASRLSFFLWSSIPDQELLDLAIAGRLRDPQVLEQQTRRMLADPRSESMVNNFAAQWLMLPELEKKAPDLLLFRDYDQSLVHAFRRETELFLNSVLRENRSVIDLLEADYTFVNERLAKHYGIPNIQGSYFRRIQLPEGSPRGGLLGQGSILTITSYPTRTSPVLRGKYVLENLLSAPPPPPPPNVPALNTEGENAGEKLAMRDAMIAHRANPVCAGCHARMDPIGFALENFDAIGRWRDRDGGKPIDASGELPNGTGFDGASGLKQYLLGDRERFVSTVAEKLLMYAIGRNVQYFDQPAIRNIVRNAAGDNYTFSSLVIGVVHSVPFQMREAAGPQQGSAE